MDAEHNLSRRLIKGTELDQTAARAGNLFSFVSSSPSAKDSINTPQRQNGSRDLRSVVQQRFLRMSEAHDRIRIKMLYSNPAKAR